MRFLLFFFFSGPSLIGLRIGRARCRMSGPRRVSRIVLMSALFRGASLFTLGIGPSPETATRKERGTYRRSGARLGLSVRVCVTRGGLHFECTFISSRCFFNFYSVIFYSRAISARCQVLQTFRVLFFFSSFFFYVAVTDWETLAVHARTSRKKTVKNSRSRRLTGSLETLKAAGGWPSGTHRLYFAECIKIRSGAGRPGRSSSWGPRSFSRECPRVRLPACAPDKLLFSPGEALAGASV